MFNYYIARAINFFGLTYCRPIYEKAIEVLPDKQAKEMSIRYADIEIKLGEIDRARAIYAYASQFCDPRIHPELWEKWHDFEVQHGNEETFKEMLRIKRSVEAKYHNEMQLLSHEMLASRQSGIASLVSRPSETFVQGGTTMNGKPIEAGVESAMDVDQVAVDTNADYMDEDGEKKVISASVPDGVFSASGMNKQNI
jgi:hypothetical protein